ncbi:hypothetical protein D3C77_700840 [compost metagenome]
MQLGHEFLRHRGHAFWINDDAALAMHLNISVLLEQGISLVYGMQVNADIRG